MLRMGFPVLGVDDLPRAVAFWAEALGLETEGEPDHDWATLVAGGGGPRVLGLQLSDSPAEELPRIHLDLWVDTLAEQTAEAERLVALGASRVDWDRYPDDADFVVLADPDGNRFCIVDRRASGRDPA